MKLPISHLALAVLLGGCANAPMTVPGAMLEPDQVADHDPLLSQARVPHEVVTEAFVTAATPADNIDSAAAWTAPDGRTWLLATAKEGGGLVIYDGDTGATLRRFGRLGDGRGEFRRPNGIFVHDDLLFVVERDNARVQVLRLPELETVALFGNGQLRKPYGIWVRELAPEQLEVFVTDAYMTGQDRGQEAVPPLAELDRRVHRYQLQLGGEHLEARHVGAFGDTGSAGAIRIPESIWGDPANNRLLIAEEDVATGTALRVYSLDGDYRGRTIGLDQFRAQAEGIALWRCEDGSGYWITTDQFEDRSVFHVFDRQNLAHLGAFAGERVGNTDGVWLQQSGTAQFPAGVFYAVHDDQAVGAFDWRDVAGALDLRANCQAPD